MRNQAIRNGTMLAAMFLFTVAALGASSRAAEASAREGRWRERYFPNVPLVTHDGETVHFYDDLVKDKIVAINFIFTSCENSCSAETARVRQVHKLLGD